MSKSYGNSIADARGTRKSVEEKVRAHAHRPRPRAPHRRRQPRAKLPRLGSSTRSTASAETQRRGSCKGCTSAGIGCLECKQPVIDAIVREQQPWRERAEKYLANPKQVHWIVEMGTERARTIARQTMKDVRDAMGLSY